MDARFSISNMSTEWGPLVGWFPVDEVTIKYLAQMKQRLAAQRIERFTDEDIQRWVRKPPQPDADAVYAARIVLDLSQVTPHVSGPDTVQKMSSLAEMEKNKVAIQKAYLLSCVNSRIEDLAAAASVLQGKQVATGVKLYLGAASKWVQEEAERRGIWKTLLDAGAHPLPAGCGPCIGLGVGLLEPGEVGISATNRNFKGRMGSRDAKCYLASPEVVAASALAGYIRGPFKMADRTPVRAYKEFPGSAVTEKVDILPGFPERVRGRLIFMPQDNVNTDAIYGKDYTYRDDVTLETMAKVAMENYDPQFSGRVHQGDVIVSGFNFGTGSSREQAVTCLKAKGIPLLIAASFSQTYLRNAYNNGFLCIEVPELVKSLRSQFAKEIGAQKKTIIPGDEIDIDFTSGVIAWRGEKFAFPPLGSVPQSLVIAQGVENLVAKRLGLG
jgi:homoaconitate hydratase